MGASSWLAELSSEAPAKLRSQIEARADFPLLAANVAERGKTTPAFEPYSLHEVGGLRVAVIGAVTEDTKRTAPPGALNGLDFYDPVVMLNARAQRLKDGNPANGEADIVVAIYHDGAAWGEDCELLAHEVGAGASFGKLVLQTRWEVDAILTAHTHRAYSCDAPTPGRPGRERPVLQAGSYGEQVGLVRLTYDRAARDVTNYSTQIVPRAAAVDRTLPVVRLVVDVVQSALDLLQIVAGQRIGTITGDFSRARTDGEVDFGRESPLVNGIADAIRASARDAGGNGPLIGLMHPELVRADLRYKGTLLPLGNTDGVVTYAEADAVLPFWTQMVVVPVTGAQLRQLLEEQYIGASSQPRYHFGLSENATVTFDPARAVGEKVTSVTIDGSPLDPAATYRIATSEYVVASNQFPALRGVTPRPLGKTVRDALAEQLTERSPWTPSFARRQVLMTAPTGPLTPGSTASVRLAALGMQAAGAPAAKEVEARLRPTGSKPESLGTYPVRDRRADFRLRVPSSVPAGTRIELVVKPTRTMTSLAVAGRGSAPPSDPLPAPKVTATLSQARPQVGRGRPVLTATVARGSTPARSGTVTVRLGGQELGSAAVRNGKASVRLPAFTEPGAKKLEVVFSGEGQRAVASITARPRKAKPTLRVRVMPKRPRATRAHPRIRVRVVAPGITAKGRVNVRARGRVYRAPLRNGVATVRLRPFPRAGVYRVRVVHPAGPLTTRAVQVVRVRVR
ncbi:5'-nucleotidase C-terminal domain-containing protein [Nocardioides massiliensis]|uniref:5'-nucleotidase n=1 Tax=Nocardioides massiliensis TaxID=1325935 RepID=A0ABT9NMZ1_9ACTN|nr:5'-nucleotidase C-terminal domain-containing protein [Nocardioides massiliensis]MDP9821788.1 5'-nucleotidase [Nocardioides massiliensis]